MNHERSLANKILLFVFPLIYLLMLVAMVLFGYYVRDNALKLIAVGVFSLYLLYRFLNRLQKLYQEMFRSTSDEQTEDEHG